MYHVTTTLKLVTSIALALLSQVANAQPEFSFDQGGVPARAKVADVLPGRVVVPPVVGRSFNVPPLPAVLRSAKPAWNIGQGETLPQVIKRPTLPQDVAAPKQNAADSKQAASDTRSAAVGGWRGNPFINPGVVTAGGDAVVRIGSDLFADRSAVTIDQSGLNLSMSSLVKASATEPVDEPVGSGLSLTGPSLTGPSVTGLNSLDSKVAEPKAKVARAFSPAATGPKPPTSKASAAKEPAVKAGKEPAKKTTKAPAKTPAKKDDSKLPGVLQGAKNFKLAAQPEQGAHFRDDSPLTDPRANQIETINDDFSSGPRYDSLAYVPREQQGVYSDKKLYANQRPLVELGRPWYQLGQLSEGHNWFGNHNRITPQFLIYGDFRSAIASNNVGGNGTTLTASELNLDIDLKLTGTERFHAFVSPLDNGVQNTGFNFDDNEFVDQFDANIDFGYFEGDLGAIVGGFTGETLPFDLPFAAGLFPLLIQNGVWFDDAFLGVAATLPARNSARFNISNMDITFFAGYDKISSDAFPGDDGAARIYGVASFIEAANGYFEIDYAFLDDRSFDDRSYHNFAFAFTRRYGRLVSNSTRVIVNAGQSSDVVENTADGVLLLSENSLITGSPSTVVPYLNFFAGFDRPQSAARAVQAGGVLRNTGILFETDGLTGFPTLDATANDTYGAALGLNLLADDFSQQLLVEIAALGVIGEDSTRNAPGGQIGVGFRYQLPLSNSLIFRTDGIYGFLDNAEDVSGIRMELRRKW